MIPVLLGLFFSMAEQTASPESRPAASEISSNVYNFYSKTSKEVPKKFGGSFMIPFELDKALVLFECGHLKNSLLV